MNQMYPYKKSICSPHIYEYEKIFYKKKMIRLSFPELQLSIARNLVLKMLNTQVGLQNRS